MVWSGRSFRDGTLGYLDGRLLDVADRRDADAEVRRRRIMDIWEFGFIGDRVRCVGTVLAWSLALRRR